MEPKAVRGDLATMPPGPLLAPFGGELTASDVDQGKLKNCCLPAVLAAMANTATGRSRIRTMLLYTENASVRSTVSGAASGTGVVTRGLVRVSFGSPAKVVPVSRLLYREQVDKGVGDILYAKADSGQGWVSFIEKAYVLHHAARSKLTEASYANLILIDPKTVLQDLMPTRKPPRVVTVAKAGKAAIRQLLAEATTVPTIAMTPKAADGRFNTPHSLIANHAYAVRGLRTETVKGRASTWVRLASDEDECRFEHFLADVDTIVALAKP